MVTPKTECPHCYGWDSKVIDSRPRYWGFRRIRVCVECGRRYSTTETVDRIQDVRIKSASAEDVAPLINDPVNTGDSTALPVKSATPDTVAPLNPDTVAPLNATAVDRIQDVRIRGVLSEKVEQP